MFGCSCYILSSIVVSTAEGKFWVVTVAFSERCVLKGVRGPVEVQGLSVWYTGPQCFRTSVSQMTCGARKVYCVLRTALLNVCMYRYGSHSVVPITKQTILTQSNTHRDGCHKAWCYQSILFHQSKHESQTKNPKI
jgi:hypothetical protein